MPMPKPVCRACLNNKSVPYEVCITCLGSGYVYEYHSSIFLIVIASDDTRVHVNALARVRCHVANACKGQQHHTLAMTGECLRWRALIVKECLSEEPAAPTAAAQSELSRRHTRKPPKSWRKGA